MQNQFRGVIDEHDGDERNEIDADGFIDPADYILGLGNKTKKAEKKIKKAEKAIAKGNVAKAERKLDKAVKKLSKSANPLNENVLNKVQSTTQKVTDFKDSQAQLNRTYEAMKPVPAPTMETPAPVQLDPVANQQATEIPGSGSSLMPTGSGGGGGGDMTNTELAGSLSDTEYNPQFEDENLATEKTASETQQPTTKKSGVAVVVVLITITVAAYFLLKNKK